MAISGAWLEANEFAQDAVKWGHGFNPVHRIMTEGPPLRSKEVITGTGPGNPGNSVNEDMTDPGVYQDWNYVDEDFANADWGYGEQTGTADRPGYGTSTQDFRGQVFDDWPPAMESRGLPGGSEVRAENRGADNGATAKLGDKEETVGEGWENKQVGDVLNARVSDPSQYEMQTSMTQRDKVREGSQRGGGSASEYMAPIESRRATWPQRIKLWSTGRRLYDMVPRAQDQINRPFLFRQPGTGIPEWMIANEAYNYQLPALQRQPVPDPYGGNPIPAPGNVYQEESGNVSDWVDVWY